MRPPIPSKQHRRLLDMHIPRRDLTRGRGRREVRGAAFDVFGIVGMRRDSGDCGGLGGWEN